MRNSDNSETNTNTTVDRLRQVRHEHRAKSEKRDGGDDGPRMLPPPGQPLEVAKIFLAEHMDDDGLLKLWFWRGDWVRWRGSHWRRADVRFVRRLLYGFLDRAVCLNKNNEIVPWSPTKFKIDYVIDAMQSVALLDRDIEQPAWLDAGDPDLIDESATDTIVACANGLFNVTSGKLLPHTARYFNFVAVPFAYDPQAPEPQHWSEFLRSLWPVPKSAPGKVVPEIAPEIDVLGEWFGYVISGRRDLHKAFLHVGPTRGGKGVIARIETALIGEKNTASPTLDSLGNQFGLAPLIGKPLATITDARLSKKSISTVVERLLTIIGGDMMTIDVKYHEQWTGFLPTRLHVISNELPHFSDASSAIVGRFVIVMSQRSWFGQEDLELEHKIRPELPGVFNWALAGLQRLAANGWRFTINPNADKAVITMHHLASPVRAFVHEECELDVNKRIARDHLYSAYRVWATNNGYRVVDRAVFGRDLHSAFPAITDAQPRGPSGKQYHAYDGIDLRERERAQGEREP